MTSSIAIITGASRGIGRGIALELASHGYSLVLAARNEAMLRLVTEEVRLLQAQVGGAQILVHQQLCDVTNPDHVRELFRNCVEHVGKPSVLINNAGVGQHLSTPLTTDAIWNETIAVNLTGTFLCCREAIPYFEQAGGGLIINNASVAATRGFPGFAAYCASKAGVVGLSRSLREELREKNIRVSVVLAGATNTPFWDSLEGEWNRERMISVDHVAKVIASIALQPPDLQLEEITIMPSGGAL